MFIKGSAAGARPDLGECRHERTSGPLVDGLLATDLRGVGRGGRAELSSGMSLAPQYGGGAFPAPRARPGDAELRGPAREASSTRMPPLFFESRRPFVPTPVDGEAEEPVPAEPFSIELIGTLVTDQVARAPAARGRAGGLASRGRQDRRLERARDRARPGHPRQGEETETLSLRADLDAPVRSARSGKRKRGERAETQGSRRRAGGAAAPAQSNSPPVRRFAGRRF